MLEFFIVLSVVLSILLLRQIRVSRDLSEFNARVIADCIRYIDERDNAHKCVELVVKDRDRQMKYLSDSVEMILKENDK